MQKCNIILPGWYGLIYIVEYICMKHRYTLNYTALPLHCKRII